MSRQVLFSALLMGFLLIGLAVRPTPIQAAEAIRVVTTTSDLAYFAQQVGGSHVLVEALARPTEDVHHIQVKPSALAKLNKAKLFVQIGLEFETWAPPLLAKTSSAGIRPGGAGYVLASAGCQVLEVPTVKVDRSMGDVHPAGNPHLWLSARNAKQIAANIRDGLIRIDPNAAGEYSANYDALAASIDRAAADAKALLADVSQRQVVPQHNSFIYLFQQLGLEALDYVEPRPGIAPGAQHLAALKQRMLASGVHVVVTETNLNPKTAQSVADAAGGTLVTLGEHVGALPNTDSWEALILENARRLASALKG